MEFHSANGDKIVSWNYAYSCNNYDENFAFPDGAVEFGDGLQFLCHKSY